VRTVLPVRYVTKTVAVGSTFSGQASWYGADFQGRRTASGETFNTDDLTAASKTLAFGTRLRVCRQGACVLVRVNDRGPYVGGRVLDLSRAARNALGYDGVAFVTATPVGTRTVAVHPLVRPAKHRIPRPAPPTAPPPDPQPVLAVSGRRDDAPSAVLTGALVVLAAGGLLHERRRTVHS
jgi:rare lipoprotein A